MAYECLTGQLNDAVMAALGALGFTQGQINDRMYAHLESLGFSGALPDMMYDGFGGQQDYFNFLICGVIPVDQWILEDGTWDDLNYWVDTAIWNDS